MYVLFIYSLFCNDRTWISVYPRSVRVVSGLEKGGAEVG